VCFMVRYVCPFQSPYLLGDVLISRCAFLLYSMPKAKVRFYKGTTGVQPYLDLILADIPEGLPVPGISNPPTPEWLQPIFDFADNHLHDDGAMILFHPFRLTTKSMILGYCECFGFQVRKEWLGINRLHLTSPINPLLTVSLFYDMTDC
jgi:hypothetical protein